MNNTARRIIVSAVAIPLILLVSLIGRWPFVIFVFAISSISYYEFAKMIENKGIKLNLILGILSILIIILNVYLRIIDIEVILFLVVVLCLIIELFRNQGSAVQNVGATLIGIFYIGLFSGAIIGIREYFNFSYALYRDGGFIIISVLVSIWLCDSAAFFLGTAFGKHKLFPRISPNKSWEGAFAGFVFSLIGMIAGKILFLDFLSWTDILIIGSIIGILGQIGDLTESLIKRDSGVKDSSTIIPGHGGIFDRFDSFIFSAPLIYLYLYHIVS